LHCFRLFIVIDIHISQGTVVTHLRCGGIMISLLKVSCWVWRWKNFENRSIFGETVDKSIVSLFFFWLAVYMYIYIILLLSFYASRFLVLRSWHWLALFLLNMFVHSCSTVKSCVCFWRNISTFSCRSTFRTHSLSVIHRRVVCAVNNNNNNNNNIVLQRFNAILLHESWVSRPGSLAIQLFCF